MMDLTAASGPEVFLETSDQELVQRCKEGDRQAYKQLVERYQRRVFAIAMGVLKHPEDAMDATQEAFVKVYRKIGQFKGDSSFYTWLYRIVVNLCIDHRRKHGRFKGVEYDDRIGREEDSVNGVQLSGNTRQMHPGHAFAQQELAQALDEALNTLSENHRTIILLREVDGLSYEEIAEVMDCHLGTVMSRLHHARKNLQKALKPYLEASGSTLAEQAGAGVRKRS
ncbi:MAG: sigma-70 family RNA polymerase sigma factor [Bradymonadia bacterium]